MLVMQNIFFQKTINMVYKSVTHRLPLGYPYATHTGSPKSFARMGCQTRETYGRHTGRWHSALRYAALLALCFVLGIGNAWGMNTNYTIGDQVTTLVDGDYVAWGTTNSNLCYTIESDWGKCNGTKSGWIVFKVVKISGSFYLQNTADNKYVYSSATKKIAWHATNKTAITLNTASGKENLVYNSTVGNYTLNSTGIRPYTSNTYTKAYLYKVNAFSVTYDGNGSDGGSAPTDDGNYLSGASVTVKSNSFTKTGYNFTGWNTAANGSGTSYAAGATFSISASTTLYAQWASAGCSNSVGVTKGGESHGEVTTISSASVATCSATDADRRVT